MSSTLSSANFQGHDFSAAMCIDGKDGSDGVWNFCMSNLYEPGPWLSIQVPQRSTVSAVDVYSRHDCCQRFLDSFEVWVGPASGSPSTSVGMSKCGQATATLEAGPFRVTCGSPLVGSVVTVLLPGTRRLLALAEVTPYGSSAPTPSPPPLLPPPPPSPYASPGTPGAATFTQHSAYVTMTTAGDVSDFTASKLNEIAAILAVRANVPASAVTVTAHAGSVVLTAKIVTASAATASVVQNSLSSSLSSASSASALFASVSGGGVTVIATPSITTIAESLVENGATGDCPTCGCQIENGAWVLTASG